MPTLRSRSVGTRSKSSTSPSAVAAAAVSTSTPRGSLNNNLKNNSKSNPLEGDEAPSVVGTAFGLDPLTPAGDREHACPSSHRRSGSRTTARRQTRAGAAEAASSAAEAAGSARKAHHRPGKKVLFAGQQQEQQQKHEEGGAPADITVTTRRTSKRVRRRAGDPLSQEGIMETEETMMTTIQDVAAAAASVPREMAGGTDATLSADKGKQQAAVALSASDEEDETFMPSSAAVDTSDSEEEAPGRDGSSSMDAAGDGPSIHTNRGKSLRGSKRSRGVALSRGERAMASKAKFLEVARRRAAHFAHFPVEEHGDPTPSAAAGVHLGLGDEQVRRAIEALAQVSADAGLRPHNGGEPREQWPGPFVIARQLVKGRESAAAARNESARGVGQDADQQRSVEWHPSRRPGFRKARIPTSLHDMCVEVLCANIEHVSSLEGVPDAARKLISARLCSQRIMTPNALRLYFQSEPGEVVVPDCTFVTEEILTEALANCSTQKLEVLELGLCGRAMSDQLCASTLAGRISSLPILHTLVLNGAYRLTDIGLKTLVSSTPNLSTLSLKQCNMISDAGLEEVVNSVGKTLKTLSLESCSQLDPVKVLVPLLKMPSIESLSLSGLCGMSDGIISELAVILGPRLRELYIADCRALTDAAIRAISLCCPRLKVLDMGHLPMLTDAALGSLADGCRSLRVLQLDRGKFSDTTLAALVTASGNFFAKLSLNSVRQAGDLTLSALARHSSGTLEELDLSFCRTVSDQALGLVADTCEGLREIRLFGCTQVTDTFLEGHSNSLLNVIGLPRTILDVSCSALNPSRKVV